MEICRFNDNRLNVIEGVNPIKPGDTMYAESQSPAPIPKEGNATLLPTHPGT